MDPDDVGRMAPPWRSDWGYNCTSVYNDILGEMLSEGWVDVAPIGGTGVWSSALEIWEETNINKNYPPGYFGVSPYVSEAVGQWGHLQMVWSGEAADGNQVIAQSDASNGLSADGYSGWPGPNLNYSMAWSFNNIDWPAWMGLIPGVRPIDGFPGYGASAYEVVRWYRDVCEWWYGMPLIIPICCIAAELTTVVDPARTGSIWDLRGYSDAVDHDSYGQHQQREQFYPCPWNFETAAWSFLAAVDKTLGSDSYPDPDDPRAVAELIQWTQRSFADGSGGNALGWNYEARYEWAHGVIDDALGGEGEKKPPEPVEKPPTPPEYISITGDGSWLQAEGEDDAGGRLIPIKGDWRNGVEWRAPA